MSQLAWLFPIYGEKKNVPNHLPDECMWSAALPFSSQPFPPKKNHNINIHHQIYNQWIGLRENLQETIDFPMKYEAFL